jgi:hypothetical protein
MGTDVQKTVKICRDKGQGCGEDGRSQGGNGAGDGPANAGGHFGRGKGGHRRPVFMKNRERSDEGAFPLSQISDESLFDFRPVIIENPAVVSFINAAYRFGEAADKSQPRSSQM